MIEIPNDLAVAGPGEVSNDRIYVLTLAGTVLCLQYPS
jgi:hypothetical protein